MLIGQPNNPELNLKTKSDRLVTVLIAASPMEWAESIRPSTMMEGLLNRQKKEAQVVVVVDVVTVGMGELGLCCVGCGVRSVGLGMNCCNTTCGGMVWVCVVTAV